MNQPNPGATLASVLHLRLADFGARPVVEQARLRAQLEAVVAAGITVVPERDRIVADAPDGLAIAVLGNPSGAFAVARRCLDAASVLPLCIGAHHGAIALTADGDTGQGLKGDGVRSAGVAAGFAAPSQLLATRAFREALAAHDPARDSELVPAGTFADASVRSHELFVADRAARERRRRRLFGAGAACLVLALAGASAVRLGWIVVAPAPIASAPPAAAPAAARPAAVATTTPSATTTPPATTRPATTPAPTQAATAKPAPPPAAPAPGVVLFQVTPGGQVFVDGKLRGSIPALKRLELPPGKHSLEIRYGKETPARYALDLKPGQQVVVKHRFPAPPKPLRKLKEWLGQ